LRVRFAVRIVLEKALQVADTTVSFEFETLAGAGERLGPNLVTEEAALIEALQLGEEAAYEELIGEFQRPVYNLVYRLVEDPADVSDIVQDVFIKVFRYVGNFRGQSSLKTWIYRIAVNEAHNHRRWFGRHGKREVGLDNDDARGGRNYGDVLPDPGNSPFELALRGETIALIEQSLAQVKSVFREAVVLRDIEDLTYEEIAEILEISLGTVKSRILRGREALRRELTGRLERESVFGRSPQTAEQD